MADLEGLKKVWSFQVDPLGLISTFFKKYDLLNFADRLIPKNSHYKVTGGECLLSLTLANFYFKNRSFLTLGELMGELPIPLLFGRYIDPKGFNNDALGNFLEDIHKFGPGSFFSRIFDHIRLQEPSLLDPSTLQADAASFRLFNEYFNQDEDETPSMVYRFDKGHKNSELKIYDRKLFTLFALFNSNGIPVFIKPIPPETSDNLGAQGAKVDGLGAEAIEVDGAGADGPGSEGPGAQNDWAQDAWAQGEEADGLGAEEADGLGAEEAEIGGSEVMANIEAALGVLGAGGPGGPGTRLDGPFEAWKKGSGGQESVVDMGRGFSRAGEFYVSEALLKNQARLWGLAGVMSVNHLMGAILERKMILGLRNNNDILINFANKPIKNPTLKHLMDEFQSISLNILIDHDDKISSFYFQKMINKNREYILKALGHDYQEFYSLDMANFSPKEVARLNNWLGETYGRAD